MIRAITLAFVLSGVPALLWGLERSAQSGPVVARVRLEPDHPRFGDPLTLTLEVEAEPGVELLLPQFGDALDRLSIRDFKPRREVRDGGVVWDQQIYRLEPPMPGTYTIPPLEIEFIDRRSGQATAPDGSDTHALFTPALEVDVAPVVTAQDERRLKDPRGALALGWTIRPRQVVATVLTIALVALGLILLARHLRGSQVRQQISAYRTARMALDRLMNHPLPPPQELDPFFVQLSSIIRQYVERRFALRAPELTTEEFLAAMVQSPELRESHRELLREFLRKADLVKFAGALPSHEEIRGSLRAADLFLEETRQADDVEAGSRATQEVSHV